MTKILKISVFAAALFFMVQVQAAISPIAVSLFPPVQFPASDVDITGLRVNVLWGNHRSVYGFDLGGIGNITSQHFTGIAQVAGIFNMNQSMTDVLGIQAAGILNSDTNMAHIYGVQIAGAMNMNDAESRVVGLQVAILANLAPHTTVIGVQAGIYNTARSVYGLQIGLVNVADALHGLQIGLLNINRTGLFAVCPILNFGF